MNVNGLESELKGRNVHYLEAMLKGDLKGEQEKGMMIAFESLEKKYSVSNATKLADSTLASDWSFLTILAKRELMHSARISHSA
jgi:hypothetical protein